MPEIVVAQRTAEWHAARQGRITASLAAACLSVELPLIRDPYNSAKKAWRAIVHGEKEEENRYMQWGVQFEASARMDYEAETGHLVEETGFWVHPLLDWLGASPDGLIGSDGLLECKCPEKAVPDGGRVPLHHLIQAQVQLACTGRQWCDYYRWGKDHTCWLHRIHRAGIPGLLVRLERFYHDFVVPQVEPPRKKPKRRAK